VVIPVSRLVEEQVITGVDAYGRCYAPLCTYGKESGLVLRNRGLIQIFVDGRDHMSLLNRRVVLHAHTGLELVLGGEVPIAGLVVDADDRSDTKTTLVGHHVDTVTVYL